MSARPAYLYRADDRQYGLWMARVAVGTAQLLGYNFAADGVKQAAFTPTGRTRRNPDDEIESVILGDDFLSKALDDYRQWNMAWWREGIQNGVDAGATRIDCKTETQADGTVLASVTDNGKGMTKTVLKTKFLSLGTSGKKDSPTATGGFGEAKRLLLFPWIRWEVLTCTAEEGAFGVAGRGFTFKAVPDVAAKGTGTTVRVLMPAEKSVDPVMAEDFISKCYLPGIAFTVNGKKVKADLDVGDQVGDRIVSVDKMLIYHSPKARAFHGFFIRKNGLLMFTEYLDERIKGYMVGEIVPPSVVILQSNRDGIRDWGLREQMSVLANTLAKNVSSGLKKTKDKREKIFFEGAKRLASNASNAEGKLQIILQNHFNQKAEKAIEEAAEFEVGTMMAAGEKAGMLLTLLPKMTGTYVKSTDNATQVEAAAKQMAWIPDFFVYNEVNAFKVPAEFKPETMRPMVRKLAQLWAEFCRISLIRLGYKGEYGVGWHFDHSTLEESGYSKASYVRDNGKDWLLLNPFVGGDVEKGKIYSIRNQAHLDDIFSSAIHECTHLADGISGHDEAFSSAVTRNFARVLPSAKLMLQIRNAISTQLKGGDE